MDPSIVPESKTEAASAIANYRSVYDASRKAPLMQASIRRKTDVAMRPPTVCQNPMTGVGTSFRPRLVTARKAITTAAERARM